MGGPGRTARALGPGAQVASRISRPEKLIPLTLTPLPATIPCYMTRIQQSGINDTLVTAALTLGASSKIIPASDIVVENRVGVKARADVSLWQKTDLPAHVPTPDEFRKILAEYRCACS